MALVIGTDSAEENLSGTVGNDTILAGGGTDLIFGSTGSDVIDGGAGDSDVVLYGDLTAGVFINNTGGQIGSVGAYQVLKSGGQIDQVSGIEAFHGSQYADTIHVGSNGYVFAEGGNDKIYAGSDFLILPGSGNDLIYAGSAFLDYQEGDGSRVQTGGIVAVWTSATSGTVFNDGWGNTDRFTGIVGLWGSAYGDYIAGNIGDDFLGGAGGDDALFGNDGSDRLDGGDGDDAVWGGSGNDELSGGNGNDTLSGGTGSNGLDGGAGNDTYFIQSDVVAVNYLHDEGGTADVLQVLDTAQRDAFRLVYDGTTLVHQTMEGHRTVIDTDANGASVIEFLQWTGNPDFGTDAYENTLRIVTDLSNITGRLIAVAATDNSDTIILPSEAPEADEYWGEVYANDGDDTVILSSTFKYITYGGGGNDTVYGQGETDDHVTGDGGDDFLDGGGGNDTLHGGDVQDSLFGGAGNDMLTGGGAQGEGGDSLSGGEGDDTLTADGANGYIEGGAGNDLIVGGEGHDQVTYETSASGVTVDLQTGLAADGMGGIDTLAGVEMVRGSAYGDSLTGDGADNQFRGLDGNDTIDGGDGVDRVRYDKDEFRGATQGVHVDLAAGTATDGWGSVDTLVNIEDVRGSVWQDILIGNEVANYLRGEAGNDALFGGEGDDHLAGEDGDDRLTGGEGNDDLFGGAGQDSLYGGAGEDWLRYEAGDEYYDGGDDFDRADYRDAPGSVHADLRSGIVQDGGGGTDTLVSVERITGSGFDDTLIGNDGEINSFSGEAGNDLIDGGGGWDYVWYGRSQGAVYVDLEAGIARGGEGTDRLISIEGLGGSNFSDTLLGSSADNWIEPDYEADLYTPNPFGGGHDLIDGRGGFDTVSYRQASAGIVANLGIGTVIDGLGNTDNLISIEAIDGSGFADVIIGGAGNESLSGRDGDDTISGGGGDDTLQGGAGDDTYVFRYQGNVTVSDTEGENWLRVEKIAGNAFLGMYLDDAGALVVQGTNGSSITVADGLALAGFTYLPLANEFTAYDLEMSRVTIGTLADDMLYSSADPYAEVYSAAGNDTIFVESTEGSWITADGGDDEVYGGEGADNIHGDLQAAAFGNDVLFGNGGSDTLWSGNGDDQLFGGDGNDQIFGGAGDDTIDDGLGDDTLDGGDGIDTFARFYDITTTERFVIGVDLVRGYVYSPLPDYAGATPDLLRNFENVIVAANADFILTGSATANLLHASEGNDTLDGAAGNDTLIGEGGNDTYVTDGNDLIVEEAGEGIDTVISSVTYALALELEDLTLSGTAAINGTGNTADNLITGNGAANILNGAGGNDTLAGGAGNDTYVIDGSDTVIEAAGGGVDTVQTSVAYTLGAEVENLILTGSAAVSGTGNALNNILTGNSGANTLAGGGGIDRLTGGLGKDVLGGGAGTDTFVFNAVGESLVAATTADVITDFTVGQDKIDLRMIDAFAATALNDAFLWRGTGTISSTTRGEVRFQKYDNAGTADDYTMVFIDNDADATPEMAIRLTRLVNLTASDFLL